MNKKTNTICGVVVAYTTKSQAQSGQVAIKSYQATGPADLRKQIQARLKSQGINETARIIAVFNPDGSQKKWA